MRGRRVPGVMVRQTGSLRSEGSSGPRKVARGHGGVSAPRREAPHLDPGRDRPDGSRREAGPFLKTACSSFWKQADA